MKMIALSLVGMVLLGTSAWGQTIVGESTYEDNYLHTPPPAPVEARARPTARPAQVVVPPTQSRAAPPDGRR